MGGLKLKVHKKKAVAKKTGLKLKVHKKKVAVAGLKVHSKKPVAGMKVTKKMHLKVHKQKVAGKIVVKGTRPAKHSKVTKITKHLGDTITTSVYTVEEVITETIVTVEEILTVQIHRLGSINIIISDASSSIKKATGAKKVKLIKRLNAAKKNVKDAKKKISV